MDLIDEKPIPPGPSECCENGCEPCVWDIYRESLLAWKKCQKLEKETGNTVKKDLN